MNALLFHQQASGHRHTNQARIRSQVPNNICRKRPLGCFTSHSSCSIRSQTRAVKLLDTGHSANRRWPTQYAFLFPNSTIIGMFAEHPPIARSSSLRSRTVWISSRFSKSDRFISTAESVDCLAAPFTGLQVGFQAFLQFHVRERSGFDGGHRRPITRLCLHSSDPPRGKYQAVRWFSGRSRMDCRSCSQLLRKRRVPDRSPDTLKLLHDLPSPVCGWAMDSAE